MGRIFVVELEGRNYRCKFCTTPLALVVDLLSRGFHCRRGKAYLFSNALFKNAIFNPTTGHISSLPELIFRGIVLACSRVNEPRAEQYRSRKRANVTLGPQEERMMLSGMHTVADTFCCCCGQIVGWKYEAAQERSQKYKEGKFVLERGRIIDGFDSEFYIDTHSALSSDAEDL